MGAVDELMRAWRSNPDSARTIEVCRELSENPREDWVREVANSAETWHAQHAGVLLSVGRMYLEAGLLNEAQATLVSAGKIDTRDPRPFVLLGEILLRRGDAIRAEKLAQRALDLGSTEAETRRLHSRAEGWIALQNRSGVQAVADAARAELPKRASMRPPGARPAAASRPAPAAARPAPAAPSRHLTKVPIVAPAPKKLPLPRFQSEDAIEASDVYEKPAEKSRASTSGAPRARLASFADPATNKLPARPPSRPASLGPPARTRPPEPSSEDVTDLVEEVELPPVAAHPAPRQPSVAGAARPSAAAAPTPSRRPLSPPRSDASGSAAAARHAQPAFASVAAAFAAPAVVPALAAPAVVPAPASDHLDPAVEEAPTTLLADAPLPPPALVLQHLAQVGIYEPAGGAAPAWERPAREKSRGVIVLLLAIALLVGGGVGAYRYTTRIQVERATQATSLTNEVVQLLRTGRVKDLEATDEKLSRAFDLDSRSARAGRLWLENRVLGALLLTTESRGIDSAVHRGRSVGLPEKELAVGRLASFLIEDDLAGAAAQLKKWDQAAASDAHYQLVAGAVLERAGDARAAERYEAAWRLDPELAAAGLLLARLLLLEQGVERARPVLEELEGRRPSDPSVRTLRALAWVVDAERAAELPDDARLSDTDRQSLPAPLAAIPDMVDAMLAIERGEANEGARYIERAIERAQGPAIAATLGFLSIETGNEALARKAALRALSFAALYPRARTLAARIALLGGRLDDAQNAVEELDPKYADVGVVRAVVAYETGEGSGLRAALELLGATAATPAFAALSAAPAVLNGKRYPGAAELQAFASPTVAWGSLIATDAALDFGDLALAEKLLEQSATAETSPVQQLRVARLRRYQQKNADAVAASERAFAGKPTTALIIERAYALLADEQLAPTKELLARYPALLGSASGWLGVLVDVADQQPQQATLRLDKLELPADEAPVYLRLLALRALVAAKDKRARPYLLPIARKFPRHPDMLIAAVAAR